MVKGRGRHFEMQDRPHGIGRELDAAGGILKFFHFAGAEIADVF